MLKISDGKLGVREFTALIIITLCYKGTDTTPDLLISLGKNAFWVLPVFFSLFILVSFFFLLPLMKKHNQGLLELIFGLAGNKVGIFVCCLLFLTSLTSTTLNTRTFIDIINTMYYPLTPISSQLLLFLLVCYFIAKRGFETIGRSCSIMVWYLLITGVILIIAVWQNAHWLKLFPLAGPGVKQLVWQGATYSSIFSELIVFAAFFPFVRSYRDYRMASFLGLGFSVIWIAILCALYTMVFDYPAVEYLNYPYHQLTRAASAGGMITHLEAVFLGFWVIISTLHFSALLYLTTFLFSQVLRLKDFEPLLLPIMGLVLLIGLMPENIIKISQSRKILIHVSSALVLTLPVLLWLLDRWKGSSKQ